MQNIENESSRELGNTKPILTQEDKINMELKKKIMTEKKTKLPSHRNHD